MEEWTTSAPNSSAAVTPASEPDTSGGSATPGNADLADCWTAEDEVRERIRNRVPGLLASPVTAEPDPPDLCTYLRSRELAELMERGRKRDYKPVFCWHPDGTAGVKDPPAWAISWLDEYRAEH